jgi:hypothetical protein
MDSFFFGGGETPVYTGCIQIRPTNFQGRFYDQK